MTVRQPHSRRDHQQHYRPILPKIQSWESRLLDRAYPIVWLNAVHYKVMDEKNRPVTRAIYNVLVLTTEGRKELLSMYIQK